MTGRPTPPASFLASAQPSVSSRPPRQRPRFARIPSASASTYASASAAQAARSDESLASTLETLTLADGDLKASGPGGDVRLQARPAPGTSWDAHRLQSPAHIPAQVRRLPQLDKATSRKHREGGRVNPSISRLRSTNLLLCTRLCRREVIYPGMPILCLVSP